MQLKDLERALATAERLVQIAPDSAEAWNLRGCCRSDLKQYAEALSDINRAIELSPDNVNLISNRGKVFMRLGRYDEANADFDAALAKQPDHWHPYNWGAWLLATAPEDGFRNGKRAIELATKACELTEYKNAMIVGTLACAYAEAGDFQKAIEWQEKAVELNSDDALRQELVMHLEAFRRGEPWREK